MGKKEEEMEVLFSDRVLCGLGRNMLSALLE